MENNGLNQGQQHRVECHEIWNYDNKTKIQKLVGFISLCPLCHKVKHFGLAQISGDGEIAFTYVKEYIDDSSTFFNTIDSLF